MHTRTPGRHGDRVSYGGAQYFQRHSCSFHCLRLNTCATSLTPIWKRQMSIIVGPQDGTSLISSFWHLEFVGGFQIFGKIVGCDESRMASYSENGKTEAGKKDFHSIHVVWKYWYEQNKISVDKKNQLDVTFCILYFSSNICSTCFGQPCGHHQELTTAWCYSLVLVCAVAAGRWSGPVGR